MNVAVIGSGSWGTAIACMLSEKHNVTLWSRNIELAEEISLTRKNSRYLPNVVLPASIQITTDLKNTVSKAAVVVLVTPSHAVRETASHLANYIAKNAIIVSAAKGLETGSLKRMSEIIVEEIPFLADRVCVLSGPNHAEEVGCCHPSATVVAARSRKIAEQIQDVFMLSYFRAYTNPDIIGVELGGALKNIIALGAGICDGLGYGDNARAALMTRGLAEITRLGIAMSANSLTFAGLAGVGDLIATCTSRHSRNHRAGLLFAEGKSVEEVTAATNMVVEGIRSTLAAYELSRQYKVEMPITEALHQVLYQGISPKKAVIDLMSRGKTNEVEEVAIIDNW